MSQSLKIVALCVIIVAFFYTMFGAEVMYKHVPRMLAVIEHTTYYPPNMCRILNIKALRGTGTVMWGVIRNNKSGKTIEHVWGIDKNGNNIDYTCSNDACNIIGVCAAIKISDYRIYDKKLFASDCPLLLPNLKYDSLVRYIDSALATNKIIKW